VNEKSATAPFSSTAEETLRLLDERVPPACDRMKVAGYRCRRKTVKPTAAVWVRLTKDSGMSGYLL